MINTGECIVLDEVEYLCFDRLDLDGKHYLCLITVNGPNQIRFAEQAEVDGQLKVRLVSAKSDKQKIATALQAKIQALQPQEISNN